MTTDTEYNKQLNKYNETFRVWQHSAQVMVIGTEARLITPYCDDGSKLGFFAVFESPTRGRTLKGKLEAQDAMITTYAEWEMAGWFPANKLEEIAKILNIRKISKKKQELAIRRGLGCKKPLVGVKPSL